MTTAITSPAVPGARPADASRGLDALRSRPWRTAVTVATAALVVVMSCLMVVSDLRARTEFTTVGKSVASTERQLSAVQGQLVRAEQRLANARDRRASATRGFDAAQSALTATEATLAHDDAGIHTQGVDVGALDTCLGFVEQAVNQLAVGQTAGGLASLRASSTSCSALDEVG